jgi:hypothetical protein
MSILVLIKGWKLLLDISLAFLNPLKGLAQLHDDLSVFWEAKLTGLRKSLFDIFNWHTITPKKFALNCTVIVSYYKIYVVESAVDGWVTFIGLLEFSDTHTNFLVSFFVFTHLRIDNTQIRMGWTRILIREIVSVLERLYSFEIEQWNGEFELSALEK